MVLLENAHQPGQESYKHKSAMRSIDAHDANDNLRFSQVVCKASRLMSPPACDQLGVSRMCLDSPASLRRERLRAAPDATVAIEEPT